MSTAPRILVADNKPDEVRALIRALKVAGYEVLEANDCQAAMRAATERQPDLILVADNLCAADGLEVYITLQSQQTTATIPVMLMTEHVEPEGTVEADTSEGCDSVSYVSKPLRSEDVLARVALHLRLRKAERQLAGEQRQAEKLAQQLIEAKAQAARLNRSDPLTRLLSWRAWQEAAAREHDRAKRYDHVYSILMIDLDHFKPFNEAQGHQAGDACLGQVAECVVRSCRTTDLVGRYGGGEVLVLAPETTVDAASALGERVRKAIRNLGIPHPESDLAEQVTASIGIAGRELGSWEDTFKRAGEALLIAKQAGRDRIYADHYTRFADDEGTTTSDSPFASLEPSSRMRGYAATILVVDDDPDERALCKRCLEHAGYQVNEAEDGETALATTSRDLPDVIIMDVVMPRMDGLECTRRLKAEAATRDIPIIMVSARSKVSDVLAGLEAGADEYLSKPIKTTELTLRVQSMVRLRREHLDLLRSNETRGEQARVLSVLFDFCRALAAASTLDEVLTNTIAATADVCASRRVSIMLPDSNRGILTIAKSKGIDDELAAAIQVPIGEAIAGRVFQSSRAVVVNSVEDRHFEGTTYDAQLFASVPLVSAPLGASSQVVGVLNVTERFDGRPFKAQELKYIDLIANVAGSAIHGLLSRDSRDQARDSIVVALAKLAEHRDNDTGRHVDRVTQYCLILAQELRKRAEFTDQIDDTFIHDLERAAPLHDIGKVAVPDHILLKPGRLSPQEMDIMRPHTVIGAETIRSVTERAPGVSFLDMAERIAHFHHEWWNGAGYPQGLSGEAIPLCARIAALADVYDALTTKRVYKDAFSHDRSAAIIIESSGTQFDPEVVEAFQQQEHEFARLAAELADTPEKTPEVSARLEPVAATTAVAEVPKQ